MIAYNSLKEKPFFIVGPCQMESYELLEEVAEKLVELRNTYQVNIDQHLCPKMHRIIQQLSLSL